MICPNCNAHVSDELNFCENCGTRLVHEPQKQQLPESEQDADAAQVASWQAHDATSAYQTTERATSRQVSYDATSHPYGQYPTTAPISPVQAPKQQASSTPFVLSIVALVLMFTMMFPVSIILAIIALVMNSGQKKRGEASAHHTPTFVMSLITLIFSGMAMAILVAGCAAYFLLQGSMLDTTTINQVIDAGVEAISISCIVA